MNENVENANVTVETENVTPMGFRRDPDVIDAFKIPDEMARELSYLLGKAAVKRDTLLNLIGKGDDYNTVEDELIEVQEQSSALQVRITMDYVPEGYRRSEYTWEYPGYKISKNEVWIKRTKNAAPACKCEA